MAQPDCLRTNTTWLNMLRHIISIGADYTIRGKSCREVRGLQTRVNMRVPVITVEQRKLGYKFMPGEAHWILSGSNELEAIAKYSKRMREYSDDGLTLFGAYGEKVVPQLAYVVDAFNRDLWTRQAVINIWRECPPRSRDIPCTLSLQFLIRNGQMDCVASMRSSDAWLGWPYDVFSFSMITAYVCLLLRERKICVCYPGELMLTAGSAHLYDENVVDAYALTSIPPSCWEYKPMSIYEFNHPDDLRHHLGQLANADHDNLKHQFLAELGNLKRHDQTTKNHIKPG